jgi:hypothetical protein
VNFLNVDKMLPTSPIASTLIVIRTFSVLNNYLLLLTNTMVLGRELI